MAANSTDPSDGLDCTRSRHVWYRRLVQSVKEGRPKIAYLVGTILIFNGEQNFPRKLTRDLRLWMDVATKPGEETTTEKEMEKARRCAVMDAARSFAAELGVDHISHRAQRKNLITMSLNLVNANRCGLGTRQRSVPQSQAVPSFSLPTSTASETLETGSKRPSLTPDRPEKTAKRSRVINAED